MTKKKTSGDSLSLFHPLVEQWFRERIGDPTDVQERAWPEIARGGHVLVTAPTGSGKTLTAFLWAINRFLVSADPAEPKRVLYISPLKALNNDIRRNLEAPLEGLREYFNAAGEPFPEITVGVRSGDTEQDERRAMIRRPPDIFITTPESLNIILSSKSGRRLIEGISTVILDEIHAVAPTKRGAYLMSAVERLVPLNGEFRRIALSATVKPLDSIAAFVGGYEAGVVDGAFHYTKRRVGIVTSSMKKRYDISVAFPEMPEGTPGEKDWWLAVVDELRKIVDANTSTLIFANSRRMVEKITRLVNEHEGENRVYSHHGSLSKEIRSVVESRLKQGDLAAIVATGSLELGIDIGAVDKVVLVQTPYSVASAIQRIGRAGHGVGQVSSGIFRPVHTRDLLEASVIAENVGTEDIEMIQPVEKPLDVLAQVILSMVLLDERDVDELYGEIRASSTYNDLTRKEFDLVVEMLAGRYAETRIRELRPRIVFDRLKNTIRARDNARPLLYLSGGVIPDRGYFNLRDADTKAKIGELDEEFVWERSLGDAFPFGNRIWRIVRVTHNDVEVTGVSESNSLVPFWKAEDQNRSFHLSEKIGSFLEEADGLLETDEFRDKLMVAHRMTEVAADALIEWLKRQKKNTGALPARHTVVVEHFRDPAKVSDTKQTVLHTLWGGAVNRPFALVLAAAWEEKFGYPLEVFANNDCILLNLPHDFSADDIVALADPGDIPRLLRKKLESTGYFGARFRENAQCSLLLPRRGFRDRMPLWLNRLRSKKLLEAVARFDDFPVTLETWRTCLNRDFDLDALSRLLDEIREGITAVIEAVTDTPSPFSENIIWRQTNYYMYEDDTPASKLTTGLSDEIMRELVFSSHLRPSLSDDLIRAFGEKVRRVAPGYTPDSPEDVLEWLKERLYIPSGEWRELLDAVERDHDLTGKDILDSIGDRVYMRHHGGKLHGVAALENLPEVSSALGFTDDEAERIADLRGVPANDTDLAGFLAVWLRFYGPVRIDFVRDALGIDDNDCAQAVETLIDDRTVVVDNFRSLESSAVDEICDAENLEILLRMRRAMERPAFEPLPVEDLPRFLAAWQGLVTPGEDIDDLRERMDRLFGYQSRAALWETDILPARLSPYYTSWLDSAMRESDLVWFGCGVRRIAFSFARDLELFPPPDQENRSEKYGDTSVTFSPPDDESGRGETEKPVVTASTLESVFDTAPGKMTFNDILGRVNDAPDTVSDELWNLAWRGNITNDDFTAMRRGIMNRFRVETAPERPAGTRRRGLGFNRWKNTRPFIGNWYSLYRNAGEKPDALEEQELVKDRIRQLFMRYGVLFREILENELPSLRWRAVFRTLRLMELSGEIVSGSFFTGVPGLQFCSQAALRALNRPLPEDAVWWMNACDPASLCGNGIDSLRGALPPRLPSTHIVYHDRALVLVSRRNGAEIVVNVPPDHPRLPDYFEFFGVLIGRRERPLKMIETESVNGTPAIDSPYRPALTNFGFVKEYKTLVLRKRY